MRFEATHLAWVLLIVPALAIFFRFAAAARRRRSSRFADPDLYRRLAGGVSERRRRKRPPMVLAACLLLGIALLDPQWGYRLEEVSREGIDLMVAVDTSRSMLADDVSPNRLERAKRSVRQLVTLLRGDRVGLIPFAGTAHVYCPLTLDYRVFLLFLNDLSTETIPRGGTDIASAIEKAAEAFAHSGRRRRALVIFTDGEHLEGDLDAAVERAREEEIRIFAIGFGSPEGKPLRIERPDGSVSYLRDAEGNVVVTRLDESTLERIAVATGGAYHRATPGGRELELIYRERIARMERDLLDEALRRVRLRRFQWPLGLGLALLFLEGAMGDGKGKPLSFLRTGRRRKEAVALIPLVSLALLNLGMANPAARSLREGNRLFQEKRYEEARESYRRARADRPDAPESVFNLGNVYYRLDDYGGAESLFRRAAEQLDPERSGRAWYNLGNSLFRAGELRPALDAYREAIRRDPEDPDAKFNYELVKRLLDREEEPRPEDEEEEEREPEAPEEEPPPEGEEDPDEEAPADPETIPEEMEEELSPEDIERLLDILLGEEEDMKRPLPAEFYDEEPPLRDW